jgi:hypothetical protein
MATNVTITASSDSGWIKAFIDGNEVLEGPGNTTVSLNSGHHYLTYFVQGNSGDNYSVAITDPPLCSCQITGTLTGNYTTGQHGFDI